MEKFWLSRYPEGVPESVDADCYASLNDMFAESAARFGARPAFHNMGRTLSYNDIERDSRALAAYFQNELGLQRGSRIALMMPNLLQYPIALFAVLRSGGVVVNVNPLYTGPELEHQLNDSGAETIIILENFADTLESVIDRTPVRNVILTRIGDCLGGLKGWITSFAVKHVKKMVPQYSLPQAVRWGDCLNAGREAPFTEVDVDGNDLAFLQYTGGTTGVAKGAMLTHRNLVANLEQVSAWLNQRIEPGQEVVITALPLYHIFCLTCNCLAYVKHGGMNVLITNPRDIPGLVKELGNWRFTMITGVNTLFNAMINEESFARLDFSALKLAVGGGMAVQQSVAERWQEITDVPLLEGYGLTESSPVVCINPADIDGYTGSIGLPVPSTEVSFRDEGGQAVAQGEAGELWVRGPQVMAGYWQRPEATADTITAEGWLKTGDIAVIDDEGFVRIVDRKKDMILVSGFNVFPNEIEDALARHPQVLEVACIGVPDDKSGEAVKVFVVRQPDAELSREDLIAFAREQLTGYKVPRLVEFTDELPKSNVGKILRRKLRDAA